MLNENYLYLIFDYKTIDQLISLKSLNKYYNTNIPKYIHTRNDVYIIYLIISNCERCESNNCIIHSKILKYYLPIIYDNIIIKKKIKNNNIKLLLYFLFYKLTYCVEIPNSYILRFMIIREIILLINKKRCITNYVLMAIIMQNYI